MRNTLTYVVLGLGLTMFCADEKGAEACWVFSFVSGTSAEGCWVINFFCGNNCHNDSKQHKTGSNNTLSKKISLYSPLEVTGENFTHCLNETKPEETLYCSVIGAAAEILNYENGKPTPKSLKDSVDSYENLLVNSSLWDSHTNKTIVKILPLVMDRISSTALSTALEFPGNISQTVVQNSTVIQTYVIRPESFANNKMVKLEAQGDQMVIHFRAVTDTITKPVAVAFISFNGLESLLEKTLLQNETLLDNEMLRNVHMNSRVVSSSTSLGIRNISIPVNLTFQHLENKVDQETVRCVEWNFSGLSHHGCQHIFSNITHSKCSCKYLSNFAVLMGTTQGDLALYIISNVGLSISVICLFLCIVTFLFCRSSHNSSTFIHLQLSFCLFFADLLFIVGMDKTYNKMLCSVIAGMLKYLFLACFVWMFLEAVNLYFIVRNLKVANYSGASKYMKISMYLCGYGFPVLIVAISAAVNPGAFGTHHHCWLNQNFIWSFMGPICAIIVINLVLFCLILKNLHEKLSSLNSKVTTVKNTRSLLFKAIAHVFILGMTWCFGFFQYDILKVVMAYLFTITNSVQGIFIFLVHCLLNQKVREAYRHWICYIKDTKLPVSEIAVTSFPISNPSTNVPSATEMDNMKIEWGKAA